MKERAFVLFSGGQDSTTCLAQALHDFDGSVHCVGFKYGQLHSIELEQASKIAKLAGVGFDVVDLSFISDLSDNALTNSSIPIEHKDGELPSTFVEGRNMFFLSSAAVLAKKMGCHVIYTGVCQTDYSGYPDCRDEFIKSLEKTTSLALDYKIEIRTPLMWLTKAETILLMDKLGNLDWYGYSHTCYKGQRPACGTCPACRLRLKGFEEAGVKDPLSYSTI